MKNIPVIKLDEELQEACFAGETEPVIRRIQWVLGQNDEEHFILAMPGKRNPGYMEMEAGRSIDSADYGQGAAARGTDSSGDRE